MIRDPKDCVAGMAAQKEIEMTLSQLKSSNEEAEDVGQGSRCSERLCIKNDARGPNGRCPGSECLLSSSKDIDIHGPAMPE